MKSWHLLLLLPVSLHGPVLHMELSLRMPLLPVMAFFIVTKPFKCKSYPQATIIFIEI